MLNKIPGFRTGQLWKKVLAIIGYIMFLLFLIVALSSAPTTQDLFVNALEVIFLFLAFLIPIANLFRVRKRVFLFNRQSKTKRVFGYIGYVIICIFLFSSITNMESPISKQMRAQQSAVQKAQTNADADSKAQEEDSIKAKADADAKAKAQAEADAKAKAAEAAKEKSDQTASSTQATTANTQETSSPPVQSSAPDQTQPAPTQSAPAPNPQPAQVKIVSIESPVPRNGTETVIAQVPPGSTASIEVDYASGPSHAAGLNPKTADSSGKVSWSWHVGGRTTLGTWPVTVSDNGASDQASFEVVH